MKVAFFSSKSYDQEYFDRFNSEHELKYFPFPLNGETAPLTDGFRAVCVFVNDQLDRQTLAALSSRGVEFVVLRCAGFNNVDLQAAADHRIRVARVPGYSPHAVAEHAVALILTLNRKTHKAYNRIRENNFSIERLTGFDLYGKTVGVIGTGQIGSVFSKIMLGFGCRVLAFDIRKDDGLSAAGISYTGLDDLFAQSDIISLHCPLTPETRHLIGAASLARMRRGAMLINTSRGAVLDTGEVIRALKTGHLGYLGIDVYEQESALFFRDLSEEIIQDDRIARLMSFPNVLITSHQGFFTREALEQIAKTTLGNLTAFEQEKPCPNEVPLPVTRVGLTGHAG